MHKPVKGVLKLEVEKLHASHADSDNISEGGSVVADSNDAGDHSYETSYGKHHGNGLDRPRNGNVKCSVIDRKELHRSSPNVIAENHSDCNNVDVSKKYLIILSYSVFFYLMI